MANIQVQIEKNTIQDVLLDGELDVNIVTNQLRTKSDLLKLKLAPYNLRMAN